MRYTKIRELDISNGEGVGVALFVQGCHFHCHNCFNPETWDFNGGKEWTKETQENFLELINKPYIKRVSILGGEPLAEENLTDILDLINKIRLIKSRKSIWLYTGYTIYFTEYLDKKILSTKVDNYTLEAIIPTTIREKILENCDVVVDGRYIDSQKDITLKWKGSANQHVIDVRKSLRKGEIILWKT